jgi:hypothetical protein
MIDRSLAVEYIFHLHLTYWVPQRATWRARAVSPLANGAAREAPIVAMGEQPSVATSIMATAHAYLTEPEEASLFILGRDSACTHLGHHGEIRGPPSQEHPPRQHLHAPALHHAGRGGVGTQAPAEANFATEVANGSDHPSLFRAASGPD